VGRVGGRGEGEGSGRGERSRLAYLSRGTRVPSYATASGAAVSQYEDSKTPYFDLLSDPRSALPEALSDSAIRTSVRGPSIKDVDKFRHFTPTRSTQPCIPPGSLN